MRRRGEERGFEVAVCDCWERRSKLYSLTLPPTYLSLSTIEEIWISKSRSRMSNPVGAGRIVQFRVVFSRSDRVCVWTCWCPRPGSWQGVPPLGCLWTWVFPRRAPSSRWYAPPVAKSEIINFPWTLSIGHPLTRLLWGGVDRNLLSVKDSEGDELTFNQICSFAYDYLQKLDLKVVWKPSDTW